MERGKGKELFVIILHHLVAAPAWGKKNDAAPEK
jgi:hypothetical protein